MGRQALVRGLLHRASGELEGARMRVVPRSVHVMHARRPGQRDGARDSGRRGVGEARRAHAGQRQSLGHRGLARDRATTDDALGSLYGF